MEPGSRWGPVPRLVLLFGRRVCHRLSDRRGPVRPRPASSATGCGVCTPDGGSTTMWSPLPDGIPCGDGGTCLNGRCCIGLGGQCGTSADCCDSSLPCDLPNGQPGTCGACIRAGLCGCSNDPSCCYGDCNENGCCVPAGVGGRCGADSDCGSGSCGDAGVCLCVPSGITPQGGCWDCCNTHACGPDGTCAIDLQGQPCQVVDAGNGSCGFTHCTHDAGCYPDGGCNQCGEQLVCQPGGDHLPVCCLPAGGTCLPYRDGGPPTNVSSDGNSCCWYDTDGGAVQMFCYSYESISECRAR